MQTSLVESSDRFGGRSYELRLDVASLASLVNARTVRGLDLAIAARVSLVANALGGRAKLASTLKVPASQTARWIKGDEAPNFEDTRAIMDLEHVVLLARLLWGDDEVVNSWLTGRSGFLDGARPIDVIATQGSGPVIDALDQATVGAFV